MATTTITGSQIKAGRALAGIDQAGLGKAAGLQIQTVVRIERYPDRPVQSHNGTVAKVLAGLGSFGVLIVPGGAVKAEMLTELVTEMRAAPPVALARSKINPCWATATAGAGG